MEKKIIINDKCEIHLYCDNCNIEMEKSNIMLLSYPPQYRYTCKNCDALVTSLNDYPKQCDK